MRFNPIPLIASTLLFALPAFSQQDSSLPLLLKNNIVVPQRNITEDFTGRFNNRSLKTDGQSFAIIQFDHIPSVTERKQLSQSGIELLDYIPQNAYTVSIKGALNKNALLLARARSVVELAPQQKMSSPLNYGIAPTWAVKVVGTADVWISFYRTLSYESVSEELKKRNFDIISSAYKTYHVIALRVAQSRLNELAALPFIEYVQAAPPQDQPLNFNSKNNSRANVLQASAVNGGYDLHGEGVTIGVGDNTNVLDHIDFTNRFINRNPSFGGVHGVHVAGIATGAGIIDERFKGYAPKSTLITQAFGNVFFNAPAYVQDYGMVITNNSYGAIVGDCDYNGLYDLYSRILDQQAFDFPNLQNVFAVGNSGTSSCPPYPAGFKTALGSYQAAKNVICVGNTVVLGTLLSESSKGPVQDGRIKPEITAQGTDVTSTWPVNIYIPTTGTSMASPAVSGGLGLLYQRYRQLNSGANPKNGLMKALICNGGTDQGNTGPDFSYGFGWMNLVRSIDMLNNTHYFISTVANGVTNNHTITVPANTAQVKVMLYWNDPAANVLAAHTLVNDLDLSVVTPSPATLLPAILDTVPANVNTPATTGVDRINNIEQIVINNPTAGSYTVNVNGFAVTQNPSQEYFLVYDIIPISTTLTFPTGNEPLLPGESVYIDWDSYGNPANAFTIEYSPDNGATWPNSFSAAAGDRQLLWTVPATPTEHGLLRVTRNGTAIVSTSHPFVILARPTVNVSANQCEGYFAIDWNAVTGATDYEVFMLRGDDMVSVGTTGLTSYVFNGLSKDSTYWVSVRARINGKPGLRAVAVSRQPNNGSCGGGISANDLKIDSLIAPVSGRQLTSTALTASTTISVRIKNLDVNPANSYDISYSINGGSWNLQTIGTPLNGGSTVVHNFTVPFDFSAAGVYTLRVAVHNNVILPAVDATPANDTMTYVIKQLANTPITISVGSDFTDDLETATVQEYNTAQTGLIGLDRYDFVASSSLGRIRTFLNTGIAYSGSKAITLDAYTHTPAAGNADSLTGTFNLSAYTTAGDDIRLDFRYKNHGQQPDPANKVWIRGNDLQPWIEVYDLYTNQEDPGIYKKTSSIELSDLLAANAQNFSSSFQVRWGQWGDNLAADNDGASGYTFDDFHLYKVSDDIQMLSIDSPIVASCALTAATRIWVSVRNSVNTTVNNIPVKYRIDGGSIVTENIASIGGNATLPYMFATFANLLAPGTHIIEAWVDFATDTYRDNDTARITIINSPRITSFPYLENFEAGNGSWYANGKKSSWQYGTPASNKIASAASGSKAWKTTLTGNYNDLELSYLYSPCFDVTGMTNPTLSFSLALDIEDCGGTLCDGGWVEYSTDGVTWTKLGAVGTGTNWYNKNYGGEQLWSIQDYTRWHVATTPLPTAQSNLRLRFVMASDPGANREGMGIDDIHIYDNTKGIYDGATMGAPVTQNVAGGTTWIDFTSAGKLVASIQPNNLNMGNTDVQAYIYTGSTRYDAHQYYHNRNITIIPTNASLADSVTVRFYFLDNETEALISASGCPGCSKPGSAYELGVSKFTDVANRTTENGTIIDDNGGVWSFIAPSNVIKVPFDKGYYAEFKVRDFSEFWLNNGTFTGSVPLPVKLVSFRARKQQNDVLVEWKTADEQNINKYEIEMSHDNQTRNFVKIGEVASLGNSSQQGYSFLDREDHKTGVRYYRLKIIENNGSSSYSPIRPVVFDSDVKWDVYPNPSNGLFNFIFQQNPGETIVVRVHDMNGKLVHQSQVVADGFAQKLIIDLRHPKYTSGLYMITAEGSKKQVFKVLKQ